MSHFLERLTYLTRRRESFAALTAVFVTTSVFKKRFFSSKRADAYEASVLLLFWMILRSIDLTQIYSDSKSLYVFSLSIVGFLLSHYLPLLSGVATAVYALYFSSMIVALGLLYASQSTLLCSAFTLDDQPAFGRIVIVLGIGTYLMVLASMTTWLTPRADSRQSEA